MVWQVSDQIFVDNITTIISEEKIVMWRNFSFPCMTIVGKLKISPHVEKFQMSPHYRHHELYLWRKNSHVEEFQLSMYDNCREIEYFSTCGEISVQLMGFHCNLCWFVAKSVIHAVLSQNFCHNLRDFMWRKIEPKSTFVEKKWQISGMHNIYA